MLGPHRYRANRVVFYRCAHMHMPIHTPTYIHTYRRMLGPHRCGANLFFRGVHMCICLYIHTHTYIYTYRHMIGPYRYRASRAAMRSSFRGCVTYAFIHIHIHTSYIRAYIYTYRRMLGPHRYRANRAAMRSSFRDGFRWQDSDSSHTN